MKLEKARTLAQEWVERLKPYTTRIEIAGSIRRCKPEVGDVEIVCIPKVGATNNPLLLGMPVNLLEEYFESHEFEFVRNGPRWKTIILGKDEETGESIKLDLFIVLPPAQWGVIFLIRTGSALYAHRFVELRKFGGMLPSNLVVKDGCIWLHGQLIETPEEEDVYRLIGLPWIPPQERIA